MHRFRVKFLPPTDMLYAFRLDVIEKMSVPDVNCIDINDAIEYNEIHKYFETGVCLKGWTDDDFSRYHRISDSLYGLAQQFFQRLNNQNIIDHYHMVDISYRSRFWDCFCACKLHNSISPNVFDQLMQTGHVNGNDVFRHKELVRTYGNVLKQFIMDNEIGVSLLIDEYEHKKGLFIPDELKPEEKIDCIEKYIDSPDPNTNTLLAIYHMHSTRKLPVKDSLRLKAKRRYEERVEELSKKAVVITHDIHLILADNQIEEKVMNQSNHTMTLSYSRKWLDETLDYPSILNNFIYIFEFADYRQMRWSLVSLESEIGVLERVFTQNRSALYYPDGDVFRNKNQIAQMQINAYYKYLLSHNIRLEEVLEWFYSEYLQTEFGCPEMKIKLPSKDSSNAEKCYSIIPAFESAVRQYSIYVESGEIDFDLIAMSAFQPKFNTIPSMIHGKNVYGGNHTYRKLSACLFSDQNLLSFVQRIYEQGKSYASLIELIKNETVKLSDYQAEEKQTIQYLVDNGLLKITDDEVIMPNQGWELTILSDLYRNESINRYHYPAEAQPLFDSWLSSGILEDDSLLFTKAEANYLSYVLNRAEYCNGLELRNKYMHGNQQVIADEGEHYRNYLTLLILFVLVTIKINDEFVLKEHLRLTR